jgi:hypothetical protein
VFAVIVLGVVTGQILSRLILLALGGVPRFSPSLQPILAPVVQDTTVFLLIFVGLWAWVRWSSGRPFWTLGFEHERVCSRVLRGSVVAACMITAVTVMITLFGESFAPGLIQTLGVTAFGIRLASLLSYGVQGPAEEVLFRGWLMPVLGARYRPIVGIVGSSALFSVAHGLSQGITAVGFLNLFLFGLFTAVYALAEGGLWGVAAWHGVWNWMQGDVFGFSLDGSPHVGLVRSIQPLGPAIITGGAFGPEGGLACTAVLLSGTIAAIAWGQRRDRLRPVEISRASD